MTKAFHLFLLGFAALIVLNSTHSTAYAAKNSTAQKGKLTLKVPQVHVTLDAQTIQTAIQRGAAYPGPNGKVLIDTDYLFALGTGAIPRSGPLPGALNQASFKAPPADSDEVIAVDGDIANFSGMQGVQSIQKHVGAKNKYTLSADLPQQNMHRTAYIPTRASTKNVVYVKHLPHGQQVVGRTAPVTHIYWIGVAPKPMGQGVKQSPGSSPVL